MKKVLLIEDNVILIGMMQFVLEHQGYHVLSARTGIDGIRCVDDEEVDLIITDIGLPYVNGYDIIKHIRKGGLNRDVPIIIISALTDKNSEVAGLRLGANDVVRKPISSAELVSRVHAQLSEKMN